MEQIEDRRPGAADVEKAGGGRGKAEFHGPVHRARESSTTRPRAAAEHGFTLVEVLVAMLILTIVALTSVTAFASRKRHLQQARELTLAYQALQNEAEYRRRIPFDQLESAPTSFMSDTSLLSSMAPFAATAKVVPVRAAVRDVVMTVRWPAGRVELVVVRADTGGSPLW